LFFKWGRGLAWPTQKRSLVVCWLSWMAAVVDNQYKVNILCSMHTKLKVNVRLIIIKFL
jgi:hypothetical protein